MPFLGPYNAPHTTGHRPGHVLWAASPLKDAICRGILLRRGRNFPRVCRVEDHGPGSPRQHGARGGQFGGSLWLVHNTRVLFVVRTGRRAERTVRRGHRQPVDLWLLQSLGYLPREMYQVMGLRGTRVQLARASRIYLTTRGHLEVQEVEARLRFRGCHYVYWNLQCLTSYQGDPPTDSSESWSLSESESTEGFV